MSSWFKRQLTALEHFTIDVIYGRAEGTWATLYAAFLQALSYAISAGAQLKWWLYRKRIFLHDQPLGCLVVVVGNLTAGARSRFSVAAIRANRCTAAARCSIS